MNRTQNEALLQVQDLHVHYGKSPILHGVTFQVGKGEVVSLLGRNGSGRSTTLKAIMGLVSLTSGEVRLNGLDLACARPYRVCRAGISFVPEEREIFANLTVDENLRMGEQPPRNDAPRWTADQMFDYFPLLKQRRKTKAGNLSGGEQQMLTVVRTLMGNPRVILVDEPTEGLAPLIVKEVFATVRELRKQGVTIFLVEQNAVAALEISDRAYLMETGEIILEGAACDLSHNPEVKRAYLGKGYKEVWE